MQTQLTIIFDSLQIELIDRRVQMLIGQDPPPIAPAVSG